MKPGTVFLFILLISFCASAQTNEKITTYFNADWKEIAGSNGAAFYRTVEKQGSLILVRDYFISGKIQMFAECSATSPSLKYHGKCLKYYEDGVLESEAYYDDNISVGRHKSYYPGGRLKSEMFYRAAPLKTLYVHHYSEAGDELLSNGAGTIQVRSASDFDSFEEIKDSILYSLFDVNKVTHDTIYYATDKPAEYPGGLPALARDVKATLNYPKSARKARIEGTVYVSFIISKAGDVTEAKVIKSVSPDCDAEALSVLWTLKRWIPGESHGKPAKCRFVLPIKFRL
jgi:protein TonB